MDSNRFRHGIIKLAKYTSISAIALVLDYSIYLFFLGLGLEAPTSSILGYLAGLILAYFLMKNRVFTEGWLEQRKHFEFIGFLMSGFFGVVLTYLTVYATNYLVEGSIHLAKINAVVVSFVGVYFFRRYIVFRKH